MTLGALSGFTVAVTADRRHEEQIELIARRGGDVLHGAVIRTLPLSSEAGLQDACAQLIERPPDLVVLSTAVGVRGWLSGAEGLGVDEALLETLRGAEVLVRGPKAAGAAVTGGLQITWQAPDATYVEVLAHLADRAERRGGPTGERIALQLDGDRPSRLPAALEAMGYEVVPIPVYEWLLPSDLGPALRVIAAVADGTVDAITFTSAHAVTNLVTIAEQHGQLDAVLASVQAGRVAVACVGPVTAARARSMGLSTIIEPRHPRLGAMVQALAADFAERVVTIDLEGTSVVLQGRLVAVSGCASVLLTDRERSVLEALARRPGAVVSKRALREQVWRGESDDHVVEVTVARLRRKLDGAGDAIETVVRRGYRLAAS